MDRDIQLGDFVTHPEIYFGKEKFEVVGIRKDTFELLGDWSGLGMSHSSAWYKREGCIPVLVSTKPKARSVLQDWVMELPLREQGTLLTSVRGCDNEPKQWTSTGVAYSPGRRLTAFIRWCFMVPADPREVDLVEGAFMLSKPPGWTLRELKEIDVKVLEMVGQSTERWVRTHGFKPSEYGHLPQHWYSHAMHALEVISYRHPDRLVAMMANDCYEVMCHNMHVEIEEFATFERRLSEDRIKSGTVVS